jgi:hypothetical protein
VTRCTIAAFPEYRKTNAANAAQSFHLRVNVRLPCDSPMNQIEAAPAPWLTRVYADPLRYVEEIAIVEGLQKNWRFWGWYDEADPTKFILVREEVKGAPGVYLYGGNRTAWCLQQIPFTKFYLQTDRQGAKAALATWPVTLTGTVRYFRVAEAKLAEQQLLPPPDRTPVTWSVDEERTEAGRLGSMQCRGLVDGVQTVSASTAFISTKSAMIGVETNIRWRERGLGRYAVGLLIGRLLNRGISPVYATDVANVPSMRIAKAFFERHVDLLFLFVGRWHLRRPKSASGGLPDSLFLS